MADFGALGLLASLIGLVIAIAMMLAQFRLFSIDKTMKQILAELKKGAPHLVRQPRRAGAPPRRDRGSAEELAHKIAANPSSFYFWRDL